VTKLLHFKKYMAKLNKKNEYMDQIKYKTLTLIRDMLLDWH